MNKTTIIFGILSLTFVCFTGCGEKKEKTPAETATSRSGQATKLEVSNVDDRYLICERIELDGGFEMGQDGPSCA